MLPESPDHVNTPFAVNMNCYSLREMSSTRFDPQSRGGLRHRLRLFRTSRLPSRAPTRSATPGSAATKYDGEWEGATGEGASLSFSVESGSIVFLLLQPTPGELGPSLGADPGAVPVSPDGTFHCKGSPGPSHSLVFEGRFTSDTEASGACTVDGSETTWQAERKDAEEHSGSPEPIVGTTYDGEWGGQIAASIDDGLALDHSMAGAHLQGAG